jgi:hypothetical protein
MNDKKGDIYFRDFHGNFHKLDVADISNELSELSGFDSILSSSKFELKKCDNNYHYYKLLIDDVKNSNIKSNKLILDKGLFRLSVYITINSSKSQKIYFFLRDKLILDSSLQVHNVYDEIPNNLNLNLMVNSKKNNDYEIAIISKYPLKSIETYIMYSKVI